ncbi:MAG: hypothetical protein WD771_05090 [Gemmatimonadaceae bacterium]
MTEAELVTTDPKSVPDIDVERKDLFWSVQHPGAKDRLIEHLATHGLTFRPGEQFTPPPDGFEFQLEVRQTVDAIVRRAVAKIAFNYLAKVTAKEYPTFVYSPDFNPIRCFIRYGEGDMRAFVRPMEPRSEDQNRHAGERAGRHHFIAATWDADESTDILGTVILFSERPYDVRLALSPKGVWIDLRSAHDYNLETLEVSSIPSGRLVRPVAGWMRDRRTS